MYLVKIFKIIIHDRVRGYEDFYASLKLGKKTPPLNYHKLCIHNVTSTETNKKVIPSFRHTYEFDNSNEMEHFLKKQTSVVHLI